MRLTPAQRRALVLLATPGAEARHPHDSFRWPVLVNGEPIGSVAAMSLYRLRTCGLVDWRNGGEGNLDFRQSITEAGRAMVGKWS